MSKVVVIFNSPAGTGKDECCSYLSEQYGWNHLEFKKQLFKATCERFGVDLDEYMERYSQYGMKDEPWDKLGGMSQRAAQIDTSENHIKPNKGKSYFGERLVEELQEGVNVVSDGGFVEEFFPVYEACEGNMIIVQLSRDGCTFAGDSRDYVNLFKDCQYVYADNNRSIEYIQKVVAARLKQLIRVKFIEAEVIQEPKTVLHLKDPNYRTDGFGSNVIAIGNSEHEILDCCTPLFNIPRAGSLKELKEILYEAEEKGYHLLNGRGMAWSSAKMAGLIEHFEEIVAGGETELYSSSFRFFTRSCGLRAMVIALLQLEHSDLKVI